MNHDDPQLLPLRQLFLNKLISANVFYQFLVYQSIKNAYFKSMAKLYFSKSSVYEILFLSDNGI